MCIKTNVYVSHLLNIFRSQHLLMMIKHSAFMQKLEDTHLQRNENHFQHENFQSTNGLPNDIAILRFASPLDGARTHPISLPQEDRDFINSRCLISGWGETCE